MTLTPVPLPTVRPSRSEVTPRTAERAVDVDTEALGHALTEAVEGDVWFTDQVRALYATDGSNYRHVPIGVVAPRHSDDVAAAMAVCRHFGAPVLGRGAGTSLAGQTCNTGVIFDFSRYMNQILEIDADRRTARVQPGVVLDHLRLAAEAHGLTFGPDPSTHSQCTLGGMIGNNSCGVHSVIAGRTADNVRRLEILTYDGTRIWVGATSDEQLEELCGRTGRVGEIYRGLRDLRDRCGELVAERFPDIPRRVSGYNLDELLPHRGFQVARALTGTESTCAMVLEAEVELIPAPSATSLVLLGYQDIVAAAADVGRVLQHRVVGLEGIDDHLIHLQWNRQMLVHLHEELPPGKAWLMAEVEGDDDADAERRAEALAEELRGEGDEPPTAHVVHDEDRAAEIWQIRESGLAATARTPAHDDAWPGWEDAAVPPDRLADYLADLYDLYDRYGYEAAVYGHFGDGCIHSRVQFDLLTDDGIADFRSFMEEAAELVVSHGGSLSGEHGDGQARAELLPIMFGDDLVAAFGEFKAIWDPDAKMNPGKVVDPRPLDADLRYGLDHRPAQVDADFGYPADRGNFARAVERCVGVGNCRRTHTGTMCPSYMATLDEAHSTRGRARLLFEMLRGETITDGWRSEEVKDALDLCFACKACATECPVEVDMATYKAEFLAHHYRRRLRPRAHYSMGLLPYWAPLMGKAPTLVNAVTQTTGLSRLARRLAGIEPRRPIPPVSRRPFHALAADRTVPDRDPDRGEVLVWADTFTGHFHAATGMAALAVLDAAGFEATTHQDRRCCGLPMLSLGMVRPARRQLRKLVDRFRPEIEAGTPIVGLEPSCLGVLRHDLFELFPHDVDAQRLSRQVVTVAELLEDRAGDWEPPQVSTNAVVQGHCHQRALVGMDADLALMRRAGIDAELLDAACCGLAGSFGFEPGHHEVSMAAGERVLFPRVRATPEGEEVLADGFSCRAQIEFGTGREARHLVEVLADALADDQRR